MPFNINMSAGEFFDLIRPAAMLVSALLSAWVLFSARKRFPFYAALSWAIGTVLFPLIVLPIYLCAILIRRRPVHAPRRPVLFPMIYGIVVVIGISSYFYFDNQSVDAHLARAARAKLRNDATTAINEYQGALALEDDPHTHKLLALELARAGYLSEAISEFRLAQQGREPDDLLHYDMGLVLERLNQNGQAKLELQDFLLTDTCTQSDPKCEDARERIKKLSY